MKRKSISTKERARLFELHGGLCHICGGKIQPGQAWEIEHVLAFALSGDDSDENRKPAHTKCHKPKTARDKGLIAKARRRHEKHMGFHRSRQPFPGGKGDRLKRRMDGKVVPR